MATKFKIDTSGIVITPKEKEAEILADYRAAYVGQKGDLESDREFFERKVSEHILSIHESTSVSRAQAIAGQSVRDDIEAGADIPKRKDSTEKDRVG